LSGPVLGLPAVVGADQGGLLGLAVDPKVAENGLIYWSYAEPAADGTNNTAVARGKLTGDRVENVQVIFHQTPSLNSTKHYGGRLVFAPDGTLFITTGERSILEGRAQAQRLDGTLGKVVRINSDGSIPKDNPFVGKPGVKPEIWSYGHRNILSAAIDPKTGKLWEVEHGARGGDELNQPQAGKDYGWPTISYGLEYSGKQIGAGLTAKEGMEQPVYYWDPVIAPAGMAFYEADLFPAWKGNILIGGLASKAVVRLVMQDGKVVGEERLLTDLNERIRDVIVGPDGALYLATDSKNGRVLKVTPKG
jgi:glucose/arabinose dehydrogenase